MSMRPVTLSDLPQILNELNNYEKAQVSQIAFYKNELDGLVEKHRNLATSPMSTQARLTDALKTLAHESKGFIQMMRDATGKSVRLYWQQQLLNHEYELEKLEQEQKLQEERMRLYEVAQNKLAPLLPKLLPHNIQDLQASSGRIAVNLSQAQGDTLRTAFKLIQLEEKETNLGTQWTLAEISQENAQAAAALSDFESNVMDWCLQEGRMPEPVAASEGFGVGMLGEMNANYQQLANDVQILEQDIYQLRETLAQAIDASEKQQPIARELFQFAKNVLSKHDNLIEDAAQPLPF